MCGPKKPLLRLLEPDSSAHDESPAVDTAAAKEGRNEPSMAIDIADFAEQECAIMTAEFAERERAIQARVQRLKPTLRKGKVPGDGNCFFHSVAVQTIGDDEHLHVRRSVVEEVADNLGRYEGFVSALQLWHDRMKIKGTWGDGLAARACSNVYMAPVVVWRCGNPSQAPTVFLPENPICDRSTPILLDLDEKASGVEHYSPL